MLSHPAQSVQPTPAPGTGLAAHAGEELAHTASVWHLHRAPHPGTHPSAEQPALRKKQEMQDRTLVQLAPFLLFLPQASSAAPSPPHHAQTLLLAQGTGQKGTWTSYGAKLPTQRHMNPGLKGTSR